MNRRRDRASDLAAFTSDLAPPVRRGRGLDGMLGTAAPAPIERGTDTELSLSEMDALVQCEAIIERGLKTFFEVGTALVRIRDLELYRIEYRTFEAYCADRWGISRPRAYELMNASQVVSAIADKTGDPPAAPLVVPQNEAQARPLTRLKDVAQQRAAWQQAVETAPDGRITAAHVEQVVKEMLRKLDAALHAPAPPPEHVAPRRASPAPT
ncbi:MAG: hypothetical protein HC876_18520, partial [Chloroflexaceae bacterium]|nr:hypothetical protein [Chloroflexaceae bacterium]